MKICSRPGLIKCGESSGTGYEVEKKLREAQVFFVVRATGPLLPPTRF
jgi:hypothetical protein